MTLCEQLVYLHYVDFNAAGIPQEWHLDTIRLCLDDNEVYIDRIVMSVLERISLCFVKSNESPSLAYMRTIILTCNKHEMLHPWICQVLLPRLIEGKIYNDWRYVSIRIELRQMVKCIFRKNKVYEWRKIRGTEINKPN
jgi:symplekin